MVELSDRTYGGNVPVIIFFLFFQNNVVGNEKVGKREETLATEAVTKERGRF